MRSMIQRKVSARDTKVITLPSPQLISNVGPRTTNVRNPVPKGPITVDGIPFRIELEFFNSLDGNDHSVYVCHFPHYESYYLNGMSWVPWSSDQLVERKCSSALIVHDIDSVNTPHQRRFSELKVIFDSGHSSHKFYVERIDERILKLIFLWERDFQQRSSRFRFLGKFLSSLLGRVNSGEVLSYIRPFTFLEWMEHGPRNAAFEQERRRRMLIAEKTGNYDVVLEPLVMPDFR